MNNGYNYNNQGGQYYSNMSYSMPNQNRGNGSSFKYIVVFLLLVALGVVVYFLLNGNKNSNDNNVTNLIDIELREDTITLKVGDNSTVNYNTLNSSSFIPVNFSIMDPEIAEVDNYGNLKGMQEGTTQLILSFNNGKEMVEKRCTVIVEKKEEQPVDNNNPSSVDNNPNNQTPSPNPGTNSSIEEKVKQMEEQYRKMGISEDQIKTLIEQYRKGLENPSSNTKGNSDKKVK